MQTENEKIFVRKIKSGYLATFNGVKGKGKQMIEAIERAHNNYKRLNGDDFFNQDFVDAIDYSMEANANETTSSLE